MGCCGEVRIERYVCGRSVARACVAYLRSAGRCVVPRLEYVCVIRCRGRIRRSAAVVVESYRTEVGIVLRYRSCEVHGSLIYRRAERRVESYRAVLRRGKIRYALTVGVFSCQVVVRRPAVRCVGRVLLARGRGRSRAVADALVVADYIAVYVRVIVLDHRVGGKTYCLIISRALIARLVRRG